MIHMLGAAAATQESHWFLKWLGDAAALTISGLHNCINAYRADKLVTNNSPAWLSIQITCQITSGYAGYRLAAAPENYRGPRMFLART
jgi:hypothetical protein